MEERITKKIHKLRQKPQHVREAILLVAIAIAAAILLTFWVATFNVGSSIPQTNSPESGVVGFLKRVFTGAPASVTPVTPTDTPPAGPATQ